MKGSDHAALSNILSPALPEKKAAVEKRITKVNRIA